MFCPNCGKALPDTAKFCPDCGTAIKAAAPAVPEPPIAPQAPAAVDVPAVPQAPAAVETPVVPEAPAAVEVPAVPEPPVAPQAPAAVDVSAVPQAPAAVVETPAAPEMPAAPQPAREAASAQPPVYTQPVQPVQPPVYTQPQQPAAPAYTAQPYVQQPAQPQYAPAGQPRPVPRPKVKKPLVPMLITFISVGLAVAAFLVALLVFGGQKKGDASLRPRDLLGVWDLSIEIQGVNEIGETASLLLEADMRISEDPEELYGDEYMLVELTPTRIEGNGEEEELDDYSLAPCYALLRDGKLYFDYLPDIQIAVPMQRSGGSVVMPVDAAGFTGKLNCQISK